MGIGSALVLSGAQLKKMVSGNIILQSAMRSDGCSLSELTVKTDKVVYRDHFKCSDKMRTNRQSCL